VSEQVTLLLSRDIALMPMNIGCFLLSHNLPLNVFLALYAILFTKKNGLFC
jgi:hypothetical protein